MGLRESLQGKEGLKLKLILPFILAFFIEGFIINGFFALLPFIREEFALNLLQVGLYSTFSLISATLVGIISGRVVDQLGSKNGLLLGLGVLSLLMLLHALAPVFSVILLLSFLTGLAYSMFAPAANKMVVERIEPGFRALSMGFITSGYGTGAFLGAGILPVLGVVLGWRRAILSAGIFALFIFLIVHLKWHRGESHFNSEQNQGRKEEEKSKGLKAFIGDLGLLLENKYLLCLCGLGAGFGLINGALPAHFTIYLHQDLGYCKVISGLGFSLLQLGGLTGVLGWGLISDRFLGGDRGKSLLLVGLIINTMLLVFGLAGLFPFSSTIVFLMSFLLGFGALGWWSLFLVTVGEMSSNRMTGMVTGFVLIFIRLGMSISPPLVGYITDLRGAYDAGFLFLFLTSISTTLLFFHFISKVEDKPGKLY